MSTLMKVMIKIMTEMMGNDDDNSHVRDENGDDGFNTCALGLTLVENNVNDDEESEDRKGFCKL